MAEPVRDAVFGNVGSMVSFRVSPDDSPFLVKYFEPQFEAGDLSQFHNRHFVTSMSINGEKANPFSATTLNIPDVLEDNSPEIITHSRATYAKDKKSVESAIRAVTLAEPATQGSQQHNVTKPQPTAQHATASTASTQPPNAAPKLSESQKRRLRRKRAAAATTTTIESIKRQTGQSSTAHKVPSVQPLVHKQQANELPQQPPEDPTTLRLR